MQKPSSSILGGGSGVVLAASVAVMVMVNLKLLKVVPTHHRDRTQKLSSGKGSDLKEDSSRPETPATWSLNLTMKPETRKNFKYFLDDKDVGEAIKSISTWNNARLASSSNSYAVGLMTRHGMGKRRTREPGPDTEPSLERLKDFRRFGRCYLRPSQS